MKIDFTKEFRLASIVRFDPKNAFTEAPTYEGLSLECTIDGGKSYFVIATIKSEGKDDEVYMETVGDRFNDYVTPSNYSIIQRALRIGFQLVEAALLCKAVDDDDEWNDYSVNE